MGLRLKSQMAAFLFALFGSTIVLVTYFNVSILSQTLRAQAEQEGLATATQVALRLREAIPEGLDGGPGLRGLSSRMPPVERYLDRVPGFRLLQIFDPSGAQVYSLGTAAPAETLVPGMVRAVVDLGEATWRLWSHETAGPPGGEPLGGVSPFYRGYVSFEYFRPLRHRDPGGQDVGPVRAVLYLSLKVPFLVQRLQVVILGNAILALLFLVTAFIAINLWGEHAVNRPLNSLLLAQEQLGRGDYTAHIDLDIPSANEMLVLTNSFNRMARDLADYQGALEEKTRRLEEVNRQYRELNERLEHEVEEKTQELREFFSLVTHDLRIPLAAIQGYAELLGRGELSDKQARYVRSISTANAHLLELVRNLLDAVRLDAGQVQILPESVDLADLLAEVVSHLSLPAEEAAQKIQVHLDLQSGLAWADRTRIGRVLANLLSNALRFSPPDEPVLLQAMEEGDSVRLEVVDRGPGIPQEHLPLLFEKFRHFPSSEGPSSGMGLGLYIVRRILEGHGVAVHVESRIDLGTRFHFSLPVSPPAPPGGAELAPPGGMGVLPS